MSELNTSSVTPDVTRPSIWVSNKALLWNAALPIALLMLLFGFTFFERNIISPANLVNIAQQTSYLALFAMAQMIVILTRGIDISLGPTVSMVSVGSTLAMALAVSTGQGVLVAVGVGFSVGIILGLACGLLNGVAVAILGVSPFIATLGSYNIAIGIATSISNGKPVQNVPELLSRILYTANVAGIPIVIVISALVAILLHLILTRTVFGRTIYMIGSNPRASLVAGLPLKRTLVVTYMLSGALAALGAILLTARTGSGEPNLGGALSLQAIAAAVVGGTSFAGAKGGVRTAILGALFVTVLSNGMNLTKIDGYLQMVVLGGIIILGVSADRIKAASR